jgi:hypothetical protein
MKRPVHLLYSKFESQKGVASAIGVAGQSRKKVRADIDVNSAASLHGVEISIGSKELLKTFPTGFKLKF